MIKVLDRNKLKEQRFLLAHRFGGFREGWSHVLGKNISMEGLYSEEVIHFVADKK